MIVTIFFGVYCCYVLLLLLQAVAVKSVSKPELVENNSDSDKQDEKPAPVFDELGGLLPSL